jgi:hypothetical protein
MLLIDDEIGGLETVGGEGVVPASRDLLPIAGGPSIT